MVEEKVYKVPNVTVDAIVTRSRLTEMVQVEMANKLKHYSAHHDSFLRWEQEHAHTLA